MVRFQALGPVELTGARGEPLLSVLAQPRRLALLSYLLLARPPGFQRRDTLLALFWPDSDAAHARDALSQALRFLRRSLGDEVLPGRGLEEVGVAREYVRCDALELEAALTGDRLEDALELYRGELLEGFNVADAPEFERWLDGERARLRQRVATAAATLAARAAEAGNPAGAAAWARRGAALEPFDEAAHRRLLAYLDAAGDRAGALREHEAFRRRLEAELESEPAPETVALVEAIRKRAPRPEAASANGAPAAAESSQVCAGAVSPDLPAPPREQPLTRRRAARIVVPAALLVALVGAPFVILRGHGGSASLEANRVVVDRFENRTGDRSLDAVGAMAADWLIQGLERTKFSVVPLPETLAPADGSAPASPMPRSQVLATRFQARLIVTGAYYLEGDSLRLLAQIADAAAHTVLYATQPILMPRTAPSAGLDSLQHEVIMFLGLRDYPAMADSWRIGELTRLPTYPAYQEYILGIKLFASEDHKAAAPHFERAVALDSSFVLGLAYAVLAHQNQGDPAGAEPFLARLDRMRPLLTPYERAMADWLDATRRGDLAGDYESCRRALALAPSSSTWLYLVGTYANRLGRPREALGYLQKVPPGYGASWDSYWQQYTTSYHLLDDHRWELAVARRAREEKPNAVGPLAYELIARAGRGEAGLVLQKFDELLAFGVPVANLDVAFELDAHGHAQAAREALGRLLRWLDSHPPDSADVAGHERCRALALAYLGRSAEARQVLGRLLAENAGNVEAHGWLGWVAAAAGDSVDAGVERRWLEGVRGPRAARQTLFYEGMIVAELGEPARAVALLRGAYAQGRAFNLDLHRQPGFRKLRGYPGFIALLQPQG